MPVVTVETSPGAAEDMAGGRARRGTLRIYLGAAPGVGKTFAMLNEGRRRAERGADVVVGFVVTHGRPKTAEQIGDLERVPRRRIDYRGTTFEEMDVDAILARRPEIALVDELAHTNVPGCRNEKRCQDVAELLAAGIHVLSTVNIQHLESINDVVERITGVKQQETIADDVVRDAEQVELVDMTPEALRRRMAHGNIYAVEKIDAALANYFRVGNLAALRELALLWVADQVDDALEGYRERHGITDTWETRERVIVAVTGAPGSERLIRRAARLAQRAHGELIGVHVSVETGLTQLPSDLVEAHRRLLEELGGEYREVTATDVADALVDVARAENGTQIVLGASRRTRWQRITQGSVISRVIDRAGAIDVHVISADPGDDEEALPVSRLVLSAVPRRQQLLGWLLAAVGLPLLTLALANLRSDAHLPTVLLLYLVLAMGVALVGGVFPATAAVLAGFVLADYYFTEPLYTFTVGEPEQLVALSVYALAAAIVCVLVDRVGRLRLALRRAQLESEAMAALAGSLAEEGALPHLVAHLRTTFAMRGASLLRRLGDGWRVEVASGVDPPSRPEDADVARRIDRELTIALSGRALQAADERVLAALVGQLETAVEAHRLQGEADRAGQLAAANDLRTALLQAVSHDLRTPLAGIKASISSLRQPDMTWSEAQTAEFHETIETETDRLDRLVANLLDMSRIQVGAFDVAPRPVALEDVVAGALASMGATAAGVEVDVPLRLPRVEADAALLERVIGNLVDNAVRLSPAGSPVRIEAGEVAGSVDLRVVDCGPGFPALDRERLFEPFQRTTDHGTGVGLGLAIVRGFTEAMGGSVELEDTPGGGATVVVRLRPDGQ